MSTTQPDQPPSSTLPALGSRTNQPPLGRRRVFWMGGTAAAAVAGIAGGASPAAAASGSMAWRCGGNPGIKADGKNFLGPNNAVPLVFKTTPSGGSPSERMRIAPNGRVGIGTPGPKTPLDVKGSGASVIRGTNAGMSPSGAGVSGVSALGVGVAGDSTDGIGVAGTSTSRNGVSGTSVSGDGVRGSGGNAGVTGNGGPFGGVFSGSTYGVYRTGGPAGVVAIGTTDGVLAVSSRAEVSRRRGRSACTASRTTRTRRRSSARADSTPSAASARAPPGCGANRPTSASGVRGRLTASNGLASGSGGYGVFGQATGAATWGLYSLGNCGVQGTLSKLARSFRIDHPLDPEHKFLSHSFDESPDTMNVYNGTVAVDGSGEAEVTLPDYFEVLNRDFRNQLTAIGMPSPDLHIKAEIDGNRFAIGGGAPGSEVSWQVTGIRQDDYAKAHPMVEEIKPAEQRGPRLVSPKGSTSRQFVPRAAATEAPASTVPHAEPARPRLE